MRFSTAALAGLLTALAASNPVARQKAEKPV